MYFFHSFPELCIRSYLSIMLSMMLSMGTVRQIHWINMAHHQHHWQKHHGALRVQGVVGGSPNQSSGTHSCSGTNFEASQSLRPGEIICIKTQTHHYENMSLALSLSLSLSLYENTCGHVFVWPADRIV